jgi:signal transduction histidine kinase
MTISLGLMVLGSLAIGIGAMIAISRLHQNLSVAVRGYRQLRQLYDVGFLASKARDAISADPPRPELARQALLAAQGKLNERSDTDAVEAAPLQWVDESSRDDCLRLISRAIAETDAGSQSVPSLNQLFARMSKISGDVRQSIVDAQAAADHQNQLSLWFIIGLCAVVLVAAVAIGVRQYRRVVGPVQKIGGGARAFATGNFKQHITLNADREFVALANDFNHMADELAALYQTLEQKVQAKTKELLRSEQLAAVGYLAAGVAHEINNPLGIIAGYSEHTLARLNGNSTDSETQKALKIICEEAFRCKQITDRLLSLARPGGEFRRIVSIAIIAETVVSTLAGLGTVGKRTLTLDAGAGQNLDAMADEGEMKQVLLNLIINALEAVDPNTGQVRMSVGRRNDKINVIVTDNGEGMTAQTLDNIFQPFFTEKRGQRHGTGLGLYIAHAIVTDHGGRIWAQSAGPNLGSTFNIELPAAGAEGA